MNFLSLVWFEDVTLGWWRSELEEWIMTIEIITDTKNPCGSNKNVVKSQKKPQRFFFNMCHQFYSFRDQTNHYFYWLVVCFIKCRSVFPNVKQSFNVSFCPQLKNIHFIVTGRKWVGSDVICRVFDTWTFSSLLIDYW